jgi:hypothetical protein
LRQSSCTHHAYHPFARALEFGGRSSPCFRRRHHRPGDLLQVAAGIEKSFRHPLHQRRRRRIGDEMASHLAGHVRCCRGIRSEISQHRASLLHRFELIPAPAAMAMLANPSSPYFEQELLMVAFVVFACAATLAPIRSPPPMLLSHADGVEWKCSKSALFLTTCAPNRDVRFTR